MFNKQQTFDLAEIARKLFENKPQRKMFVHTFEKQPTFSFDDYEVSSFCDYKYFYINDEEQYGSSVAVKTRRW